MMSQELIKSAGYWDCRFTINDDGVYFSKVLASASKVIFCPDARVYYRRGHASLSTYDIFSDTKLTALLESYKEAGKNIARTDNICGSSQGYCQKFLP